MSQPASLPSDALRRELGEIDIYLFDQLLKGRFDGRRRMLDAGCGHGRNLVYFFRGGFEKSLGGIDAREIEQGHTLIQRCDLQVRVGRGSVLKKFKPPFE